MGKAIIFSAPSGAGKTTLVKHLLSKDLNLAFSISACTRSPRANEAHGKDYYFFSKEEFKEKVHQGSFLEWEEVYDGNYYGTLKEEIERIWSEGQHVIFDVDVVGGIALKDYFKDDALSIYVEAPSIMELEKRLRSRETETEETISKRIGKAIEESKYKVDFDEVIVNEDLDKAKSDAFELVASFLNK